jgi:hypothetical protein
MASRHTIENYRVDILHHFDNYIRDVLDDEEIFEYWITNGVPDSADEMDLRSIAEDDEQWLDIVAVFRSCCIQAGVL